MSREVIIFLEDSSYEVAPNFDGTMFVSSLGIKRRFYEKIQAVDASLIIRRIEGIENVRRAPRSTVMDAIFMNPKRLVDLKLAKEGTRISLDDLKEKIQAYYEPGSIYSDSVGDAEQVKKQIANCRTFEELVALLVELEKSS